MLTVPPGLIWHRLPLVFILRNGARVAKRAALVTGGSGGIGLAIAKALTEAHGGHISAASRGPGQGTTFTVAVPVASQSEGVPTSS